MAGVAVLRSDAQLAAAAAAGDDLAFATLARRHARLLNWAVGRYRLPGQDRQDVLQEARIALLGACRSFDPAGGSAFAVFAVMCVRRKLTTALRLAQAQRHRVLNEAASLDAPLTARAHERDILADTVADRCVGVDPHEVAVSRQRMRHLSLLPGRLSDIEAAVLAAHLDGCSYAEISAVTGLAGKSVDNALQRARHKAASHMASFEEAA